MNTILVGLLSLMVAVSSCSKDKEEPTPPTPFVRYSQDIILQSSILNASIKYSVYLPENYTADTTVRYSVVYLLHGYGDDNNSWNGQYMRVSSIINSLESSGSISPMIYVMPQGFKTYYVNRYTGSYNYMDMFTEELVPYIDKTLRTIPDKGHRAVIGYSMGGYGAMILPSKNMDLFSVSAPLSMSYRTDQQYKTESSGGWDSQWGYIFGGEGEIGEARLTDYYKLNNPFYYFTPESAPSFSGVNYFLDCGDDEEQLLIANDTLHVQMSSLGINHEFRVKNGAHTSEYWREATKEVLPFIEDCFHGRSYRKEETISVDVKDIPTTEIDVNGRSAEVCLPSGFDPAEKYPALYFIYGEGDSDFKAKALSLLDEVREGAGSVLVLCSADNFKDGGITVPDLIAAAEGEFASNGVRIGLGTLAGGSTVYGASIGEAAPFQAVFMVEGALSRDISTPNAGVFYYFSLGDESKYYAGADALYQYCKRNGLSYEYRVFNGTGSSNSILYGLDNMMEAIVKQFNN